jgi:hypothetical protein
MMRSLFSFLGLSAVLYTATAYGTKMLITPVSATKGSLAATTTLAVLVDDREQADSLM